MPESTFYRVTFDKILKQQVQQLPGKLRQEAKKRIADLARDPRPPGSRELRGYPSIYRSWLADARYRLIWQVFDEEYRVEVYYVGLKPDYPATLGPPDEERTE
ncbi:MAG: type II toxin-antitoxin system RelE family toxin [Roseiflexaceae bacterium]